MKLLLTCKLKLTLKMQQGKLPRMQGKQNVVQRKKKELHKQFMLNALGDFKHDVELKVAKDVYSDS